MIDNKYLLFTLAVAVLGCGGSPPAVNPDAGTGDSDSDSDSDTDSDSDSDSDSDTDSDSDAEYDCTPTDQDEETACTPESECCGFPDPDDGAEVDWDNGECWGEWFSGDALYEIMCEDLGGSEPICWCIEHQDAICEPTTQNPDLACTPAEDCCGFPEAEGDPMIEAFGDGCEGEWLAGESYYYIGCEGLGTEEALCYCWEGMVCEPTTDDPLAACEPADQCCGFPTTGEDGWFDDWNQGCEGEYLDGTTVYYVMCENLGTGDAYCFCEEWDEGDEWKK